MKKLLTAILMVAIALPLFAAKPVTIKGSDTMVIMNARLAESVHEPRCPAPPSRSPAAARASASPR